VNDITKKLELEMQKHRDPSKTLELPRQGISEEAIKRKVVQWYFHLKIIFFEIF